MRQATSQVEMDSHFINDVQENFMSLLMLVVYNDMGSTLAMSTRMDVKNSTALSTLKNSHSACIHVYVHVCLT